MGYTSPLAFLLGLEGVALLRACAGDRYDWAFVEARLEEVRKLLASADRAGLAEGSDIGQAATRTGYARWALTYDEEANPLIATEAPVMADFLADLPAGTALDAACGTGRYTAHLRNRGHRVIGVDSSPEMLSRAQENVGGASFVLGDIQALPLPDESFDLVVCALALIHQRSLGPAMAEFARVLRPEGHLVTSDIHVASLYLGGVAFVPDAAGPLRAMAASRFLASDYLAAAMEAGFTVRGCAEPRWGAVEGEGGPLAQELCRDAAAAAYRDTPAAIVWSFQRSR